MGLEKRFSCKNTKKCYVYLQSLRSVAAFLWIIKILKLFRDVPYDFLSKSIQKCHCGHKKSILVIFLHKTHWQIRHPPLNPNIVYCGSITHKTHKNYEKFSNICDWSYWFFNRTIYWSSPWSYATVGVEVKIYKGVENLVFVLQYRLLSHLSQANFMIQKQIAFLFMSNNF